MPRATVGKNTERFELKTCPPDGYVVVRRMSYGEKLEKTDEMLHMNLPSGPGGAAQLNMMLKSAALRDFGNLIVEHNLTDENDRLLNFRSAADVVSLDPRVGDEINSYIDQLNSYEGTEDLKN